MINKLEDISFFLYNIPIMFKNVSAKVDFPKLEEEILRYWKQNKIFEKSVKNRPEDKKWTFLDGPPFITGLPHYGTLLVSIPKDIFPRFWTMKGYRVRRVWGWDVHGLPAENKVEIKLGIKSKREIEGKIGVKRCIEECKLYVSESSKEWEWYIDHIGRWVDFENAYRTMDLSYMETVMWVFKQMYDKGHIYKGLRVSLYCPHCATPISNFEVAMDAENYKEITDPASVYKYPLKDSKDTYILAWSTTPWNKIVTLALAVNPDLVYVKVRQGGEYYILAKTTLKMLKNEPYEIVEEFQGKKLIGKKFVPHYDYYPIEIGEKAYELIGGDFVTAEEGTGVVTIAAYGEEDLAAMKKDNIHIEMHLDEEGIIKKDVPKFGGMYYLKANKEVNQDLAERNLLYKDEELVHSVPLCWRCHTRLYYAPQNAWFVNVQDLKERLKKSNEPINWFPKHFKYGRFLKSLEAAPDWCISRSRYWGSPVPVWECQRCQERFIPGSIKELEETSGQKINDLHKPEIDEITVICSKCGEKSKRVSEVLDSWIEAGSAPYAEHHFPFEENIRLEDFFPTDFIVEYTGQIRAWFYVLHVISTALFDSNEYKNVVVTGVILGTDGRKMSKNYGNYPDPKKLLQQYGGDALRLYLMGSPVMKGEDILISEEQYRNQVKGMMLILWNIYNFFVSYANVDNYQISSTKYKLTHNILDKWIVSLLHLLIREVTDNLEKYDTISAIANVQRFINDFSTWYIRRSRDRVGLIAKNKADKNDFYSTAYEVLATLCKLLAPIVPFISEEIYRNLTGEESVHLSSWPEPDNKLIDKNLESSIDFVRKVVELAHAERKSKGIKVRQPLAKLTIIGNSPSYYLADEEVPSDLAKLICDEVNVKKIERTNVKSSMLSVSLDTNITPELQDEGNARDIMRKIQEERKRIGTTLDEEIDVYLPDWPFKFGQEIKEKTLARKLIKSDKFEVVKI